MPTTDSEGSNGGVGDSGGGGRGGGGRSNGGNIPHQLPVDGSRRSRGPGPAPPVSTRPGDDAPPMIPLVDAPPLLPIFDGSKVAPAPLPPPANGGESAPAAAKPSDKEVLPATPAVAKPLGEERFPTKDGAQIAGGLATDGLAGAMDTFRETMQGLSRRLRTVSPVAQAVIGGGEIVEAAPSASGTPIGLSCDPLPRIYSTAPMPDGLAGTEDGASQAGAPTAEAPVEVAPLADAGDVGMGSDAKADDELIRLKEQVCQKLPDCTLYLSPFPTLHSHPTLPSYTPIPHPTLVHSHTFCLGPPLTLSSPHTTLFA